MSLNQDPAAAAAAKREAAAAAKAAALAGERVLIKRAPLTFVNMAKGRGSVELLEQVYERACEFVCMCVCWIGRAPRTGM